MSPERKPSSPPRPPTAPAATAGLASLLAPAAVASLTLGLAPFAPEPHIVGKLRWLAGGAVGMGLMDWGDLLFHGAPWVVLILAGVARLRQKAAG